MKAFKPEVRIESPGRINLIGEHTDYNNGFVMPTAIDKKIFLEFRKNDGNTCRIYSETFGKGFEFEVGPELTRGNGWENYILGVVDQIQRAGHHIGGFDCKIKSELPVGAGISSSAALECGIASGINALFSLGLDSMDIVKLAQRAENEFVGSNCGIMDQYASVLSKRDHLIMLDCQTLHADYIPADFGNCKLLLLNTNVSHNLAESEYNTRRQECERAVSMMQENQPELQSLRDLGFDMLEENNNRLPPAIYNRCKYVLEENNRVLQGATALKTSRLSEFGELMYLSHEGLRNQYEVSCEELDFLVDFSRDKNFVYGSRMMGGGFGGCTLNLIEGHMVEAYLSEVAAAYYERFQIKLDGIVVLPDGGTSITKMKY